MPSIPAELWTLLGSIVAGIGAWLAARWKYKEAETQKAPDIQTSINAMVASMRDHYERLLAVARDDIKELRNENRTLGIQFDRLERHVLRLEILMVAANLDIPARPEDLPPVPPGLAPGAV
jgi:hypothetical protein